MSTFSLITRNGTAKSLTTDIIDKFRNNFHGELITPTDTQYESSRKTWNGMIDKKPALIARCADAADVKSAVNFSKEHNLFFSVRGGVVTMCPAVQLPMEVLLSISLKCEVLP